MHGDGHGGVHHNDGLLNVNGIFENRFDIILTNPPFGSRVEKSSKITEADKFTDQARIKKYQKLYGPAYNEAMEQVKGNIGKSILGLYDTGKMSTLTEVLFIERSLKLLRPGGRMGIVLPEGVLNNSKTQKIRDFVESKAKIILITSIPQDVFMASGATVKPSLLFFKKFTDEEANTYSKIAEEASKEINAKYKREIKPIKDKLALRDKKAPSDTVKKELKEIEQKIEVEIKLQIKENFNYEIPIAEVEKAGISTTGAEIENELIPLREEFAKYRKKKKLWNNKIDSITYNVTDDEKLMRISLVKEPEQIY
jgi:type I restriction enzyme M protein